MSSEENILRTFQGHQKLPRTKRLDIKGKELIILDKVIDLETVWGAPGGSSNNYPIARRHWLECGGNMTCRAEELACPFIPFKEMM